MPLALEYSPDVAVEEESEEDFAEPVSAIPWGDLRDYAREGVARYIDRACAKVIDELRTNSRVDHPTQYEKILRLVMSNHLKEVRIERLELFFKDRSDPKHAAMNKIARLNSKLACHNIRLVKVGDFYRAILI